MEERNDVRTQVLKRMTAEQKLQAAARLYRPPGT